MRQPSVAFALAAACVVWLAAKLPSPVGAQACPPYCPTPLITPAWHLHMCDEPYEEQLDDQHCMVGHGVTEFGDDVPAVYTLYCHQQEDTVIITIRDSGGGLQYINHPDGETYPGSGCESLEFSRRGGILSAGSPYYTSVQWPEGPFRGVGAGIEWYVGIHVRFDARAYYGDSAQAILSARDPAANSSPVERDEIQVHVASTTDPQGLWLTLREEWPSFPIFQTIRPLSFSRQASDPANAILQVSHGDTLTVSYCPRQCKKPYTDQAIWYDLPSTVTPTPLPTRPPPTESPTAEPQPTSEMGGALVLRPAEADVGYVPQISAQKDRPNHLGYPWILVGMWSRGRSIHYGMIQFDLSAIPLGAQVNSARLELVGRDTRFIRPGVWSVRLLGPEIDLGWRRATFEQVRAAPVLADVGQPLTDAALGVGWLNSLSFDTAALAALSERLGSTRRLSLRIDGPMGSENNLVGWYSGVDVYGRETEPLNPELGPALVVEWRSLPTPTSATSTPVASVMPSVTPSVTPRDTATSQPSATPNDEPTATGTWTATATVTNSPLPPATATPTVTVQTATAGPSPSLTPTAGVAASATSPPAQLARRGVLLPMLLVWRSKGG